MRFPLQQKCPGARGSQNDFYLTILNHEFTFCFIKLLHDNSPNSEYRTCAVLINE